MNQKISQICILTLGACLLFCYFSHHSLSISSPVDQKKIKIVVTFSVLADLVRQIGGDEVEVETIVPESSDPHIYQPRPLDAKRLSHADLIIVNGLGFEGWLDRLIANSRVKGKIVVASKKVIPRILPDSSGDNIPDPHAWHDVKNAILYVMEIKSALQQCVPHQKEYFEKTSQTYIQSLNDLEKWIHEQFQKVAEIPLKVITTHDAFGYYGLAYGIQFLSPIGLSTEAEPSAAALAALIKTIKMEGIRAVFIENLSSRKLIEQIAKEAHVNVDGVLYADSLAPFQDKKSSAQTYIGMIKENTTSILGALNG